MNKATSYAEWKLAALSHDDVTGGARWKKAERTSAYDYRTIRVRLDMLRELRAAGDNRGLLFSLNEGIHGNMGGMGREDLYKRCKFGTKQLIVEYVDEIVSALEHLASPAVNDISFEEKLDFFRRADHCFGRTAFMMSGAGSLLYFHVGVVKALWQENLLPDIISGSSGGSFVGALVSTHSHDGLEKLFDPDYLVHEVREESRMMKRLKSVRPDVMPISEIVKILDRLLPDLTFEEAFKLTGRHLNVSITAAETHQKSRLLNAITSPNVFIREAILASGAVPGVYPSVMLAAKDHEGNRKPYLPARKWVDGSVSDDMPAKRLARLYGVNHFVVSQTNPHVIPFVTDSKSNTGLLSLYRNAGIATARNWYNVYATSMEKPLKYFPALQRINTITQSVVNQDYVGDINILPPQKVFNPFRLLALRSSEEILELIESGERAAWPKLEKIRIQTRISRTLTRILRTYDEPHVAQAKATLRRRAG